VRLLVAAEFLAVAALVGSLLWPSVSPTSGLAPIEPAALELGPAEETWVGVFIGGVHVGYGVSRQSSMGDGGTLYEDRSSFVLGAMGQSQQVTTASLAVADAAGNLRSFDLVVDSVQRLTVRAEMRGKELHAEIDMGGGEPSVIDVPMDPPPSLLQTANARLRGGELTPGDRFEVPFFQPLTMQLSTMVITVEAPELLSNGSVGHWVRLDGGGSTIRRLVDERGDTIREEGAMGMSTVRMTREAAMAVDDVEPPDLVASSRARLTGFIDPARPLGPVALRVVGIDAERVPDEPGLQDRTGDVVTLTGSDRSTWPVLPVAGEGDLDATLSLPVYAAEVQETASRVVGDAPDRAEAAKRIYDFVYEGVQKSPTIGIPNGLQVLRTMRGDCNEHTALYVTLARAAGIPSRIAAGVVYNSTLGQGFYYHAWPEVRLGVDEAWVSIDPTLGQFPARATHLKLVTGDLDRQIEIIGTIGRLALEVVPTPAPAAGAVGYDGAP
jgi:hypothetical protein